MWPDLIQKSKDGGLDVIETYVFWNLHEPVRNQVCSSRIYSFFLPFPPSFYEMVDLLVVCFHVTFSSQYDFEGRKDLIRFVKTVAEAGLYVHLRIGPYVCAEWNYGYIILKFTVFSSLLLKRHLMDLFSTVFIGFCCRGFPLWLHFIPGIKFRTDNGPFKVLPFLLLLPLIFFPVENGRIFSLTINNLQAEMQRFTAKIVNMMQQENLYASQGGPIIISQVSFFNFRFFISHLF